MSEDREAVEDEQVFSNDSLTWRVVVVDASGCW